MSLKIPVLLIITLIQIQYSFAQNFEEQKSEIDVLYKQNHTEEALKTAKNAFQQSINLFKETKDKKYLKEAFDFSEKCNTIELWETMTKVKGSKFREELNTVSLAETQTFLRDTQALISYFFSDSALYIFKVLKDDIEVKEKDGNLQLDFWVEELCTKIYGYFMSPHQDKQMYQLGGAYYVQAAYELYYHLILSLKELPEDLVIIPSGVLRYVPFETLFTSPVRSPWDFKEHPYLLQKHVISYNYSATLFCEMIEKKVEPQFQNLLAFAPSFEKNPLKNSSNDTIRADLKPLKFNQKEVQNIQNVLDGNVFKGKEATLQNFLNEAPKYSLIHCATNGRISDENINDSFIAFTDSTSEDYLLSLNDINGLKLNADLITISAMETGIEGQQSGEGLATLTQSFSNVGAKSLVSSMWSVNDAKTPELMELFYQNLKAGMPKDYALREAKRAFLKSNEVYYAHPYFWSGIVSIGDMSRVEISAPSPPFMGWYLVGGLGVAFLVFFMWKRKS